MPMKRPIAPRYRGRLCRVNIPIVNRTAPTSSVERRTDGRTVGSNVGAPTRWFSCPPSEVGAAVTCVVRFPSMVALTAAGCVLGYELI